MTVVVALSQDGQVNDTVTVIQDIHERCRQLKIKCQITDHEGLLKAYLFATNFIPRDDRFMVKAVFREVAFLLHDTTEHDVEEWFDIVATSEGSNLMDAVLGEVREDIDSNVFDSMMVLKHTLENCCGLDIHSQKDKIFEIAHMVAMLGAVDNLGHPTNDLARMLMHEVANRYFHLACVFIPPNPVHLEIDS
jgi:hypothetical protein